MKYSPIVFSILPLLFQSHYIFSIAALTACQFAFIYGDKHDWGFGLSTLKIRNQTLQTALLLLAPIHLLTVYIVLSSYKEHPDSISLSAFLLLYTPVFLYLCQYSRPAWLIFFLRGCKYAVLYSILYCIGTYILTDFPERVHWNSQLGALFLILSAIRLNREKPNECTFTYILGIFGSVAIVLSGSRVASLLLIMLIIANLGHSFISNSLTKRRLVFASLVFMTTLLSWATIPALNKRLMEVTSIEASDGKVAKNSIEIRYEIYSAALKQYIDNPTLFGLDNSDQVRKILPYVQPDFIEYIEYHHHLHSTLLDLLIGYGSLGVLYFACCIAFALYFAFGLVNRRTSQLLCILLLTTIIILSIFDSFFTGAKEFSFALVLFGLIVGSMSVRRDTTKSRGN